VFVVPAALMVFGSVSRWCVTGNAALARRRTRIATSATLAMLASIGALVAVDAAQPACGLGRTCVPAARVSFALPDHWSRAAPESDQLFAATAGGPQARFVIEDGAAVIRAADRAVPTDVDGIAARVPGMIEGGGGPFGANSGVSTERVVLPIGPAVRVSFTSATGFIFAYYQTTISYWFFADDRIVVLEYMRAFGESTPRAPGNDPKDLSELLTSLRPL
jgi:hypothetical protein